MKHIRIWIATMAIVVMSIFGTAVVEAQVKEAVTDSVTATTPDSAAANIADSAATELIAEDELMETEDEGGLHKQLKSKFIEGSAGFMSLVALALVIGLAFCIERIIYLTLSEINAKKLMDNIGNKIENGDIEGAKDICRDTRGPVASICYQGLLRIGESIENIERSVVSYGAVQTANLERGCSWIKLCITIAPSLGFLGTVIGMVMAFDNIRVAGDISATIVASGMKVALITTIFGIIVALVLQLFYNYIVSKIEHITSQMEESAITLLDCITKYKGGKGVKELSQMQYSMKKKQSWLKIGLVAISAVVFIAFWSVGYDMPYEEDADFNAPLLTDMLLGFIYLLTVVAIGVTVYSIVHGIKTRGRQSLTENGVPAGRITIITWGVTFALLAITFALGSTDPIKVNGKDFCEGIWLRLSDMFIVSSGIMILLAIAAVAFGMSGYSRRMK